MKGALHRDFSARQDPPGSFCRPRVPDSLSRVICYFPSMSSYPARICWIAAALVALLAAWSTARAEPEPGANSVSVELFGKSVLYGLAYDRILSPHWGAGISGAAVVAVYPDGTTAGRSGVISPQATYYLTPGERSLTASASLITLTSWRSLRGQGSVLGGLQYPESPFIPAVAGGYEVRRLNGFLFRAQLYVLAAGNIVPWLGFSFGYAF
jgi:hypothetical protein